LPLPQYQSCRHQHRQEIIKRKESKLKREKKKSQPLWQLTVSALVVDIVNAWEIAAMTLERLFSIVISVGLGSIL